MEGWQLAIGVAGFVVTIIVNIVAITLAYAGLRQRLAVLDERMTNQGRMIANLQSENLRLWTAIDRLSRGVGFMRGEREGSIDREYDGT